MRYLNYAPGFCSGVLSIANAFKWLGIPMTRNDLPRISDLSADARNNRGLSHPRGIAQAIVQLSSERVNRTVFLPMVRMTLRRMERWLRRGCAVVLHVRWRRKGKLVGAYVFVHGVSASGKTFYVANRGMKTPTVTRKLLRHIMRFRKSEPYLPFAWVVLPVQQTNKIRYLSQRDSFRCGPYALINAFKWLGVPLTGNDVQDVSYLCQTDREGTGRRQMQSAVLSLCERFNIPLRYIRRFDQLPFRRLRAELKSGNAVLASVKWRNRNERHYTLFSDIDADEEYIEAVNYVKRHAIHYLSPDELRDDIVGGVHGWVIDRRAALCAC